MSGSLAPRRASLGALLAALLIAPALPAQAAPSAPAPAAAAENAPRSWRRFAAGFATSILAHEAGHVLTSVALGYRPTIGFDRGRPTVYSGIVISQEPHKQFLFSSMGLNVQAALDETLLDVPHEGGGDFESGVLAGGVATAIFYVTLGRTASVSDVDVMSRTGALTKNQITLLYGGVALLHTVRIARDGRYAHLFLRPDAERGLKLGVAIR